MKDISISRQRYTQLVLSFFAISLFLFVTRIGGEFNKALTSFLYTLTFYLEFTLSWWVAKSFGYKHPQGKAFLAITFGLIMAAIGQTLWFIQLYLLKIPPSVWTAVTYFIAYFFIFSGFTLVISGAKINWSKAYLSVLIPALVVSTSLAVAMFFFELKPMMGQRTYQVVDVVNLGYVILDLIGLLFGLLILRLIVEYQKSAMGYAWSLILAGQVTILVGDILQAMFNQQYAADLWPFTLINLVWLAANLTIATGLFGIGDSIRQAQVAIKNKLKITKS